MDKIIMYAYNKNFNTVVHSLIVVVNRMLKTK